MATETLPGYDDWKTHNPDDDQRWGPLPGPAIEAFIRHRRQRVAERASDAGAVRLFLH